MKEKYYESFKSTTANEMGCDVQHVPDVTYNYKEFQEPLIGEDY